MKRPSEPQYERNTVFRSMLDGRFFFVRKARVLLGGVRQVIGQKFDITDEIAPYLLKRHRPDEQSRTSTRRRKR